MSLAGKSFTSKYYDSLVLITMLLFVFYTPISYFLSSFLIDILLIILFILFSWNTFKGKHNYYKYLKLILVYYLAYVSQYIIMNMLIDNFSLIPTLRTITIGVLLSACSFIVVQKKKLLYFFTIVFWIITCDFILSGILYHGLHLAPEAYYPWSFSTEAGKLVAFDTYLSYRVIPTLYGYPYPHVEALIHALLIFLLYGKTKKKILLIIGTIAQLIVFTKTVLIGYFLLLGIYSAIYNRKMILIYLSTFFTALFLLWDNIIKVIEFYGYFAFDVLYDILLFASIEKYFNVASLNDYLFGNYHFRSENIGMSEIRIIGFLVEKGIFILVLNLMLHIIPAITSFKAYKRTRDGKYLFYIFIPLLVLIDSLHYFFFNNFQNLFMILLIYFYIYNSASKAILKKTDHMNI